MIEEQVGIEGYEKGVHTQPAIVNIIAIKIRIEISYPL
jgi:hypothetical protein